MTDTDTDADSVPAASRSRRSTLLREARSLPTVLLVVAVLVVGIPLVVALTPERHVEVFGQDIAVGARTPQPTLSGPAQIVQLGNADFDLVGVDVYGPLRPRLELGPLQRGPQAAAAVGPDAGQLGAQAVHTLVEGFLTWYLWGAVGIVLVAVAGSGLMGCARLLIGLRRASRRGDTQVRVGDLWLHSSGAIGRMTAIAIVVSLAAWALFGVAAYRGTSEGLRRIGSLSDLVGATTVSPSPVGPPVFGYAGAIIGDSRVARVGGPAPPEPEPDDLACGRSTDSAAAEVSQLSGTRVLNLACSGAGISAGLRGPQQRGAVQVPPQIGRLKQVRDLDWVAVAIGPNDLSWSDFLLYCYGSPSCDDRLSDGEFGLRMAAFARDYTALLADLDALPGAPRVVIVTSYDPFPTRPDPACPDMRGPAGAPGLDQRKVDLLAARNARLDQVLAAGADRYGFAVARPRLTPLCTSDADGMGPDLQGLDDGHPFHPTALGSLRLASAIETAAETDSSPGDP